MYQAFGKSLASAFWKWMEIPVYWHQSRKLPFPGNRKLPNLRDHVCCLTVCASVEIQPYSQWAKNKEMVYKIATTVQSHTRCTVLTYEVDDRQMSEIKHPTVALPQ